MPCYLTVFWKLVSYRLYDTSWTIKFIVIITTTNASVTTYCPRLSFNRTNTIRTNTNRTRGKSNTKKPKRSSFLLLMKLTGIVLLQTMRVNPWPKPLRMALQLIIYTLDSKLQLQWPTHWWCWSTLTCLWLLWLDQTIYEELMVIPCHPASTYHIS